MERETEQQTEKAAQPYSSDPTDATSLSLTPSKTTAGEAFHLECTKFKSLTHTKGERCFVRWVDFCERLKSPQSCIDKNNLSGWSPALFKGNKRKKSNVEQSSGLAWDYEKRKPMTPEQREKATPEQIATEDHYQATVIPTSIEEAVSFFAPLCLGALHTSYSHEEEKPRFRVVLPFSRLVSPSEYSRLWSWMYARLASAGHTVDTSTKDPSRFWFAPGHHPESAALYQACHWGGAPLDVEAILAELPKEEPKEAPKKPTKATTIVSLTPREPSTEISALNISHEEKVRRARGCLRTMPHSIQGLGNGYGSTKLTSAARTMILGFDLDPDTALNLLRSDFNHRCDPEWSEEELLRAVKNADGKPGERGYELLKEKKTSGSYSVTTRPPEKTIREELSLPTRKEAALHIQNAIRNILSTPNQIGVLVSPPSSGKSHALRQFIKALATLQRSGTEPVPLPVAIITPSHKLATQSAVKATLLDIETARFFAPTGKGGPRSLPIVGSKGPGALLCINPAAPWHAAAGVPSEMICFGCRMSQKEGGDCPAESGRIGSDEPDLQIGVQHSPKRAMKGAQSLFIDEWPELRNTYILAYEGLLALSRGCLSLLPKTRYIVKDASLSVLDWIKRGTPKEEDPLANHRAALSELMIQDNGQRRAELARDPSFRPWHDKENKGLEYMPRWKVGVALIRCADEGGKLYPYGNGSVAWSGPSAIAKALSEVENAIILTATPDDLAELKKATPGKKIVVVELPVRAVAPIHFCMKPTKSANHLSYLADFGKGLPLFQKNKMVGEKKVAVKAPLVADIEDLTSWLVDRPRIDSLLLGTYKPLSLFLRLEWARLKRLEASKEDRDEWQALTQTSKRKFVVGIQGQEALKNFFDLLLDRDITFETTWYGAGAGLDDWRDEEEPFSACVTLGDAFQNLSDHQRRWSEARNLKVEDLTQELLDEWQPAYQLSAGNEATQIHGRLGDAGRNPDQPAWHLHIGGVQPTDWKDKPVDEFTRPKHRPARRIPAGAENYQEELRAAVQELGNGKKAVLARLWKIKPETLRDLIAGKFKPGPEILDRLQARQIQLASGAEKTSVEVRLREEGENFLDTDIYAGFQKPQNAHREPQLHTQDESETRNPLASLKPPAPTCDFGSISVLSPVTTTQPEDPDEAGEERAAILEFEAGYTRTEAEQAVGVGIGFDWLWFDERVIALSGTQSSPG